MRLNRANHEEGVERTDFEYRTLFLHATVYNAFGREEKAENLYRQVGEALPNTLEGRASLHAVRMMNGTDFDEDFQQLYRLAKENPSHPFVVWTFATMASDGDAPKYKTASVEQYEALLDYWSPGPDIVLRNLSGQLDDLGQYQEALATMKKIQPGNFYPYDYAFEGQVLNSLQRYDESDNAMRHAIAEVDETKGAFYYISWSKLLKERGDTDGADQMFKKGVDVLIEKGFLPPDYYQKRVNGPHYYYPAPSPDGIRTYRRRPMYLSGN